MHSEIPMSPQQKLEREAAASERSQLEYGHLIGTLKPRDRSEAAQRDRAARLASQPMRHATCLTQQATSIDPNAKYVAEFRAEPAYAKWMTEAEFVSMRRIDDGLDPLIAVMS